jgi:hypothetical protein
MVISYRGLYLVGRKRDRHVMAVHVVDSAGRSTTLRRSEYVSRGIEPDYKTLPWQEDLSSPKRPSAPILFGFAPDGWRGRILDFQPMRRTARAIAWLECAEIPPSLAPTPPDRRCATSDHRHDCAGLPSLFVEIPLKGAPTLQRCLFPEVPLAQQHWAGTSLLATLHDQLRSTRKNKRTGACPKD